MKRRTSWALAVVLFVISSFFIWNAYGVARDRTADESMRVIMAVLESVKSTKGVYPLTLNDIPASQSILHPRVWQLFRGSTLSYQSDGNNYSLGYHRYYFGPFHGYRSEDKSWYAEE